MRKVLGAAFALTLFPLAASAEDRYLLRQDQSGLNLPGVSLPQGFDEVRAADGTSCRSSNAGAGAYADVGVIGSNDSDGAMNSGSVYGRVVVPLGQAGTRLDCRRLYDLEIQRLQSEVRLLKAGLSSTQAMTTGSTVPEPSLEAGWGNSGRKPDGAIAGDADAFATGSVAPQTAPPHSQAAQPPANAARPAKPAPRPQRTAGENWLRGSLAE